MKNIAVILILFVGIIALSGCGKQTTEKTQGLNAAAGATSEKPRATVKAPPGMADVVTNVTIKPVKEGNRSIFVLVGAGLKKPMNEIGKVFANKTGIKVEYSYAGSACLLAQIDNSRQGDCYMPGEQYYLEQAEKKGYLNKVERIAYVIPVIAVVKGNPKHVSGLSDLARKDLRVGLGEPHATALGRQSVTVLENAGLIKQVKDNVTLEASTIPELCMGITLGHLDAAIVWDAVALWYPKDVDIVKIDDKYNAVSTVPLATLKFAEDPDAAQQFIEFVSSKEGKAIFVKHGYSLTPESKFFKGTQHGSSS